MNARRRVLAGLAAVAISSMALVGCGSADSGENSPDAPLTMWARSSTKDYTKELVDSYNETHTPKISLTIVASDSFQQKVGAAAGAASLPDILASDVSLAPNYAGQGVYADITDRLKALPEADTLVPAHMKAAAVDGRNYAVPHKVDSSLIFYNKSLFRAAGLDPEHPPTTYEGIYEAAKRITALGNGTYGFYFPGNCAGCNAYTGFGVDQAGGHLAVGENGKQADIDNTALADWYGLYKRLFADGLVPPSAITGDTSTQQDPFLQGKIGIWPNGSYSIPKIEKNKIDWGYIPLGTADGTSTGTYVGGDVVGIASTSERQDAAWDFIRWTLSDDAQVNLVAKGGNIPVRTDLADNSYTAADPRIRRIAAGLAKGYTPSTSVYGEAINSQSGPWLTAVRGVVFNNEPDALATGQDAIQKLMDGARR